MSPSKIVEHSHLSGFCFGGGGSVLMRSIIHLRSSLWRWFFKSYSFNRSFNRSFVCSFVHLFARSFVRLLVHELFQPPTFLDTGVPRNKRGDIWIFLMNQKLLEHSSSSCPQSSASSSSQPTSSSSSQPPPSSSSSSSSQPPSSSSSSAQSGIPYKDLLKMWTQHQHAILIDLGESCLWWWWWW